MRSSPASNPIDVLIKFPPGASLYAPQTLATIADVHKTLESEPGVGNVWSLETLRRWLAEKMGESGVDVLKQYVDLLPRYLVRRFINKDQTAVVVSGLVPDKNLANLVPIVDRLDARLKAVRAAHPGYSIAVTGLSVIAARNSASMINRLNSALTVEFVFIAAFIGLAFRSAVIGLACLLPGIFPVVAGRVYSAASRLWSAILRRRRADGLVRAGLERDDPLPQPHDARNARVRRSGDRRRARDRSRRAGAHPDDVVLACGLAALVLSNLPALRLFGWLSSVAMLAALVGDLLILRPVTHSSYGSGGAGAVRRPRSFDQGSKKGGDNVRVRSFSHPAGIGVGHRNRARPRRAGGRSRRRSVRSRDLSATGPAEGKLPARTARVSASAAARAIPSPEQGDALNQSIVCASESYRIDITSFVQASGELVQGDWREATRDISGHLTGQIADGRFEGAVVGPGFSARVSLSSDGRRQAVNIEPSGGDITDVRVELHRR